MLVERSLTSSFEYIESALISRRYGVPGFFILLLYWNWCSYRLEICVSGNLWIFVNVVKPLVVYDVECEIAMDWMKGKCASSCVDLGYTNLFCICELTSVFFSCRDSVLGILFRSIREIEVPYIFDWEHGSPQHEMQGIRASSRGEGKVSWVFSSCGRNLGYILELRQGCRFETGVCSVKSGNLSRYERQLRHVN